MKSIESKYQGGGVFRALGRPAVAAGDLRNVVADSYRILENGLRTESKLYNTFILSLRYRGLRFAPLRHLRYASLLCGQGLAPFLGLSMFAAVSTVNDAGSGFSLAQAEPRQLCLDSCYPLLSPKY